MKVSWASSIVAASGASRCRRAPWTSTLLPVRREVYSSSGRLLKTVQIEEMREWEQVRIPWKIRFTDHLRKGTEVRIEVVRATALTAEEEQLIAREHLAVPPADDATDEP